MTHPAMHWERLGRYLAGEATPEETAEMRRWLEAHRDDAEFVAAIERLSTRGRLSPAEVEAALRRVKARRAPRVARWAGYGPALRLEVLVTAATVLIVAGIALFRWTGGSGTPGVTYRTGVGQRDSVHLADGSMVVLGPASRIEVRDREVDLTGTGYFRVRHDASHPFTVRVARVLIRDLGTEFSVEDAGTDSAVRVVVSEGSVALSQGTEMVTLGRGDVGRAADGRVEARRGAASPDDLAWMRGELMFRDTPLAQVAVDLRRWYGVELRVMDRALQNRHFTGTFTTETRERVIDVLALALGGAAELRGDTAFIHTATRGR